MLDSFATQTSLVHDATDTDLHGTKWQHLQSSFYNFQTIRVFFFFFGGGGGLFNKQDQKLSEILLYGFFIYFNFITISRASDDFFPLPCLVQAGVM